MKDSDNYDTAARHECNMCEIYVMQLVEELHEQGSITCTFVKKTYILFITINVICKA